MDENEKSVLDEFAKLSGTFAAPGGEVHDRPDEDEAKYTRVIPDLQELVASPLVSSGSEAAAAETLNQPKQPKQKKVKQTKTKSKKKTKYRKNGKKKRHIFLKIVILFFVLFLVACVIGGMKLKEIIDDTPDINPNNIYELLSENSIIYDANGNVVENIYAGNEGLRTNIEFKDLPDNLVNAFVCIEDKTFWDHHGFNIVRIVGAVYQKVKGDVSRIGGTSTITQQLARNLYLAEIKSDRDLTRKIKEAYYTLILEQSLSKEQIVEAYLNTIYLGYNCSGVASAAQAYFSKDVSDLNLMECAQLAALPQAPDSYAPLKRVVTANVKDFDSLDIVSKNEQYTVYYNDAAASRIKLVLRFMNEQGKINDAQYNAALKDNIRNYINPGSNAVTAAETSYFSDYVVKEVVDDLMDQYGYSSSEAYNLLYNGGLRINSTINPEVQSIIETEYANPENFPAIGSYNKDKQGNILDADKSKIILYSKETYFDENGDFILGKDEFEWKKNGDLMIYGGNRLNFYQVSANGETDINIEFKNLFEIIDEKLYSIDGGIWNVSKEYKTRDEDKNLILSAQLFKDKPNIITKQEDGSLKVSHDYYTLKAPVLQPQSAMVIIDYTNGHIAGMIGGRDIKGKLLFNRATTTRQPGSSIKPLSIYSVAIQTGKDEGGTFTAATPVDDMPILLNNSLWPKNSYSGYKGIVTLRYAITNSINTCAVQLFQRLDPQRCMDSLDNFGLTTIVKDGAYNDTGAASLALGGLTNGVKPLEMASAYGTFPNYGVHVEAIAYTTVTTKQGDIVLEKQPAETRVMDEDVASIMIDMMGDVVKKGTGKKAQLQSQPSAGKTGTTTDKYDIWFCGYTPQYSAAVWIGTDVNIRLASDSSGAASLWAKVMDQVGALYEREEFEMRGEFVTKTIDKYSGKLVGEFTELDDRDGVVTSEIFIKGTEPTETDDSHGYVEICAYSGYRATILCPSIVQRFGVIRPSGFSWEKTLGDYMDIIEAAKAKDPKTESNIGNFSLESEPDSSYDLPDYYCPIHNPDPETYPISPLCEQSTYVYDPFLYPPVDYDPNGEYIDPSTMPAYDENGVPWWFIQERIEQGLPYDFSPVVTEEEEVVEEEIFD